MAGDYKSGLSESTVAQLRDELMRLISQEQIYVEAFPNNPSDSLTAQYLSPEKASFVSDLHRKIEMVKLELVRRGQALNSPEYAAKKEPARNAPRPAVELDEHEKKVWEVIQRGPVGRLYCRELDAAHIQPRRTKSWKDCPGTYLEAYDESRYWRQRIQDEKSKIRRKAEQLAEHSPASKNSPLKKPA
jgi:hypothetical protein